MKYDIVIVGAGPAGIFAAYELTLKSPKAKVLLIDKGHDIFKRRCPILEGRISKCPPATQKKNYAGCLPACSITNGFGGAGAYSDGKFNITTEFGGWMTDYLNQSEVMELIKYVDEINLKHGATDTITDPTTDKVKEIEKRGYAVGLKLLRAQVRHLGTEQNLMILQSIYRYLEDKIDMKFREEVIDILVKDKKVYGVEMRDGTLIEANQVIIAPGRDGSKWVEKIMKKYGVKLINNKVDIGVRVETSNIIMQEINEHLYEGKFIFNTSVGTQVRTFCSNPSGHVVVENHSGIMTANGHAYKDPKLGSDNTNFALLVSHLFTSPFNNPNEYAREIAKRANELSGGGIIVQKLGDLLKGRRSTDKRIKEGFINPTCPEAVPGDLSLVLPYTTMKSLLEMFEALNYVTPGIMSEHTLIYGCENKFYSARVDTDNNFEVNGINDLYAIGDGCGFTRGLSQASAQGVYVARKIIKKI